MNKLMKQIWVMRCKREVQEMVAQRKRLHLEMTRHSWGDYSGVVFSLWLLLPCSMALLNLLKSGMVHKMVMENFSVDMYEMKN